jgi:PAS domain S-box-containing protein
MVLLALPSYRKALITIQELQSENPVEKSSDAPHWASLGGDVRSRPDKKDCHVSGIQTRKLDPSRVSPSRNILGRAWLGNRGEMSSQNERYDHTSSNLASGIMSIVGLMTFAMAFSNTSTDQQRSNPSPDEDTTEGGYVEGKSTPLQEVNERLRQEILERKRIEAELRNSEEQYRSLFEAIPVGVYRSTPSGEILNANSAMLDMFGYPDLETFQNRGMAFDLYMDPEDRSRWQRLIESEGVVLGFESLVRRRDRSAIWIRDTAQVIRDENGQVLYYDGILEDITARKVAEAELKQANEFATTVLNSMNDAIAIIDVNSYEIVDSNTVFQDQLSLSANEIYGTTCHARLHQCSEPCTHLDFHCPVRQTSVTKQPSLAEYIFNDNEGGQHTIEVTVSPIIDDNGAVSQVAHVAKNITERKRAEQSLSAYAAKLEQSNRELKSLTYVASHDLQEPLRKLRTFGSRLHAGYADALGEKGHEYLGRMQNAAKQMQTYLSGLTHYLSIVTGSQPFTPVDLEQVVQRAKHSLDQRFQETAGRLVMGDLPTIEAEPQQMYQLFYNLIDNALKFSRPDEPPLIKVQSQRLNGRMDSSGPTDQIEMWQITVTDNGIGFDEKYRDRIFTVFERLTSWDEDAGSGMGLAICQKVVERHWGTITAQSRPGEGATFVITLPAQQPIGEQEPWLENRRQ